MPASKLSLVIATAIWNLIDRTRDPEPLWAIQMRWMPWAFDSLHSANSIRFTYLR